MINAMRMPSIFARAAVNHFAIIILAAININATTQFICINNIMLGKK